MIVYAGSLLPPTQYNTFGYFKTTNCFVSSWELVLTLAKYVPAAKDSSETLAVNNSPLFETLFHILFTTLPVELYKVISTSPASCSKYSIFNSPTEGLGKIRIAGFTLAST